MSRSLTVTGRVFAAGVFAALLLSSPPSAAQHRTEPLNLREYFYYDSLLAAERKALLVEMDRALLAAADGRDALSKVGARDLFEILLEEGQPEAMAMFVRRVVERQPDKIGDITRALIQLKDDIIRLDSSGELRAALAEALPEVRSQIGVLSRLEIARRAAEAAELQKVSALAPANSYARVRALRKFADEHSGTVAGAEALFLSGQEGRYGIGGDPRDELTRFMDTMKIVADLESGKYPPSEWADRAASLVPTPNDYGEYSRSECDRMIAAYTAFVARHLDDGRDLSVVDYIAKYEIRELIDRKHKDERKVADKTSAVDTRISNETRQTFDDLAKRTRNSDGARYLRALYAPSTKGVLRELEEFSAQAAPSWRQRALAAMASQLFDDRNYAAAASVYGRYLNEFSESEWAWVAAIRRGQAQLELRDFEGGRQSLRTAAASYAKKPVARIVGLAFAAEASAALGDFAAELADLTLALDAWDPELKSFMEIAMPSSLPRWMTGPNAFTNDLNRNALSARAAALPARLAPVNGAELEKARWRLEHEDADGALPILERLSKDVGSSLRDEAAAFARRARLERAMAWIDPKATRPDEAAARREFEALVAEAQDFTAVAARIARSALSWRDDKPDEARRWMREGLEAWRKVQEKNAAPSKGSIEEDVLGVRNAVFGPGSRYSLQGDRPAPAARLSFFHPSPWRHPFLFSPSVVQAILSDSNAKEVVVRQPLASGSGVLFLNPDEEALLSKLMDPLGADPAFIAAQSEPSGSSRQIVTLIEEFFPIFHDSYEKRWRVYASPRISCIRFQDELRSKAVVPVTSGASGATLQLEKRNGVWIIAGESGSWIE